MVREEDQPTVDAGEDRSFRLLIDPSHGARHVTQFVGVITRGRAPFHTHAHEEVIFVVSGHGVVHVGSRSHPIRSGSSIFLPPETPHRLESQGPDALKVLGVFSPPGSPADRTDVEA